MDLLLRGIGLLGWVAVMAAHLLFMGRQLYIILFVSKLICAKARGARAVLPKFLVDKETLLRGKGLLGWVAAYAAYLFFLSSY